MKDVALVDRLASDWRGASLTAKQQAMLLYVEKLTLTPWTMAREDVDELKAAGFTERDVLDINQITGYFAYVNRLADGLGVPLERFWKEDG